MYKIIILILVLFSTSINADVYEKRTLIAEDTVGEVQEITNSGKINQTEKIDGNNIDIKIISAESKQSEKIRVLLLSSLLNISLSEKCKVYLTERQHDEKTEHLEILVDCLNPKRD